MTAWIWVRVNGLMMNDSQAIHIGPSPLEFQKSCVPFWRWWSWDHSLQECGRCDESIQWQIFQCLHGSHFWRNGPEWLWLRGLRRPAYSYAGTSSWWAPWPEACGQQGEEECKVYPLEVERVQIRSAVGFSRGCDCSGQLCFWAQLCGRSDLFAGSFRADWLWLWKCTPQVDQRAFFARVTKGDQASGAIIWRPESQRHELCCPSNSLLASLINLSRSFVFFCYLGQCFGGIERRLTVDSWSLN